MSTEMFGYVVKRTRGSDYKPVNLYANDTSRPICISIGNSSCFRDHITSFIDMASDYKEDSENTGEWDKTFFVSLDRMKVRKYEIEKKIKNPGKVLSSDIYSLDDTELFYYMLDRFIDQISWYISFADPYDYDCEYYFKFMISY